MKFKGHMSYAVHRAAVRGQGPYMLWLFWGEEETEMPLPNLTSGPDGVFWRSRK